MTDLVIPTNASNTSEPLRPLPTDHAKLRAFLPSEPTDSTVATIRTAISRIDTVTANVRRELDRLDVIDRATINAVLDAALADDNLEVLVGRLDPGERAVLTHRFEQLQSARIAAMHRLTQAETSDPIHLSWRRACALVTEEWTEAMSAPTDEERFGALAEFAAAH